MLLYLTSLQYPYERRKTRRNKKKTNIILVYSGTYEVRADHVTKCDIQALYQIFEYCAILEIYLYLHIYDNISGLISRFPLTGEPSLDGVSASDHMRRFILVLLELVFCCDLFLPASQPHEQWPHRGGYRSPEVPRGIYEHPSLQVDPVY